MDDQLPSAADLRAVEPEGSPTAADPYVDPLIYTSPPIPDDRPGAKESGAGESLLPAIPVVQSAWEAFSSFSWGKIADSVKKQSEAIVDVYKRDLSEFVSVVANESDRISSNIHILRPHESNPNSPSKPEVTPKYTVADNNVKDQSALTHPSRNSQPIDDEKHSTSIVAAVEKLEALADTAEDYLEKGLSDLTSGISSFFSQAISITPAESDAQAPPLKRNIILDRKSAAVAQVQKDASTFLHDPLSELNSPIASKKEAAIRYKHFRHSFIISNYSGKIARMINDDRDLNRMMDRIVPGEVPLTEFWARYFFKVSEVEREEDARKKLMSEANMNENEEFTWDSDEETTPDQPQNEKKESTLADEKKDDVVVDSEQSTGTPNSESAESPGSAQQNQQETASEDPPESDGTDSFVNVPSRVLSSTSVSQSKDEEKKDDWEEWE
ncbi:BSD domain-containing protein 1 [Chytridiales sp. JEL 0842]|nr:BSD domain-containing protein 1 [Chytridiales sp. JEL 0842]